MIWNLRPPAFNYMVPGPHPYIMGQSTSPLPHPTVYDRLSRYGATTAMTKSLIKDLETQYAPVSTKDSSIYEDRIKLQDFLSATEYTTEQERKEKGLTPMPPTRWLEGSTIRDIARNEINTKAEVIELLDRMYSLSRDEEAPRT